MCLPCGGRASVVRPCWSSGRGAACREPASRADGCSDLGGSAGGEGFANGIKPLTDTLAFATPLIAGGLGVALIV
ncbi:hypothetical protein C5C26_04540, partial [Rathayibacter sp. AY2B1]